MKDLLSDPLCAELVKLWPIENDDAEAWAKHDRRVAATLEAEGAASEKLRLQRRIVLLRESGFPDEAIHGALLGQLQQTVALGHAKTFQRLPARMLVLAGGCGTGKSTAATWYAAQCDDERPLFIRAAEVERRGRYDRKLDEQLKQATSIVLDDLGAEIVDSKGVFVSLLDELIDRVYAKRSIAIVTTNLISEQLRERYGARMMSRFEQTGIFASCGMDDLRRRRP
jgi:hypothetical protein